jgi:hypothetical protein
VTAENQFFHTFGEGREGVIFFGCGFAALYYFPANSLNFGKQINIGQRFSEIPPNPPLEKGGKGGFLGGVWSWAKIVILVAAQPRCTTYVQTL